MKIAREVVLDLIKATRKVAEPENVATPGQELTVYFLDDITLSFTKGEKVDFYGLTFEALGRDFSIINNLEVLVAGENDEGDEEGFIVEDEQLLTHLADFLQWRIRVMETFGS